MICSKMEKVACRYNTESGDNLLCVQRTSVQYFREEKGRERERESKTFKIKRKGKREHDQYSKSRF